MSDHNNTLHKYLEGSSWMSKQCLMGIRHHNGIFKMLIPLEWLNEGVSEQDLIKWNEIGNSLIFPAKIVRVVEDKNNFYNMPNPNFGQFHHLELEYSPKYRTIQGDARCVVKGLLNSISSDIGEIKNLKGKVSFSQFLIRASGDRQDRNIETTGNWNGYLSDYQLISTKENLYDHIVRVYDETIGDYKPVNTDCYEVQIDCSNGKVFGDNHKLAILSFYRYLWSNGYKSVVVDTLRLVNLDIDPWVALYAALSRSDKAYYSYYSLLQKHCIVSKEEVIARLKANDCINNAFSNAIINTNSVVWDDNDEVLIDRVNKFALHVTAYNPAKKLFRCVSPAGKLRWNEHYEGCRKNNGMTTIKLSPFEERDYKSYRFQLL